MEDKVRRRKENGKHGRMNGLYKVKEGEKEDRREGKEGEGDKEERRPEEWMKL